MHCFIPRMFIFSVISLDQNVNLRGSLVVQASWCQQAVILVTQKMHVCVSVHDTLHTAFHVHFFFLLFLHEGLNTSFRAGDIVIVGHSFMLLDGAQRPL